MKKLDLLDDESLWAYPSDEAESFDWSPVSLEDSDIFRDSPAKSTSHVPTDGGVQLTQRDKPRGLYFEDKRSTPYPFEACLITIITISPRSLGSTQCSEAPHTPRLRRRLTDSATRLGESLASPLAGQKGAPVLWSHLANYRRFGRSFALSLVSRKPLAVKGCRGISSDSPGPVVVFPSGTCAPP